MNISVQKTLTNIIVDTGKITQKIFDQSVLNGGSSDGEKLDWLLENKHISEEDIAVSISKELKIPFMDIQNYQIEPEVICCIPKALAIKFNCLPIEKLGPSLSVVISEPESYNKLKNNEGFLNCKVQMFVTTRNSFKKAVKLHYGV